ncbi:MAG: hypothetical protein L3J53_01280 [Proteobacteria bacterium]|nr:hypothetical protein [Pseudomonadota bacterium]
MTKLKAALIHLVLSIIVVGILAFIIFYIWYPQPFAAISSVIEPLKLLILIDVIIGPLLTFVVYKKHKSSLKFDLSVIVLLQIAALAYGSYTIYQGRPSLIVMNNGKFHYLVEKFANNHDLKHSELQPSLLSPPKFGFISRLNSLDIYSAYADIEPVSDYALMILPSAISVDSMKAQFSKKQDEIDALVQQYPDDKIVFFILTKEQTNYYVVFSTTKNKIIDKLQF